MKKNNTLFLAIAVLIFTASSCKKDSKTIDQGKDLILTAREQQKVEADNAFTFKLFKEALTKPLAGKNLMLSPLSVSMAFGMTSNGSSGATLDAIRNTMEFKDFTEAEVNSYYHKITTELPQLDPKATLEIANSIWYRNDFTPLPAFLKVNTDSYNAAVEGLNFSSPTAKDRINSWVNSSTHGKIPTIIDNISSNMVMYLINAVYFKSDWKYKFDKNKTAKSDFNLDANNKVQTDFMVTQASVNYSISQDASVYELPYGNEKYSMVIVLPRVANTSINEFASSITPAKWKGWMTGLNKIGMEVKMPKFKFSYDIELNSQLEDLGMGIAFGKNGIADFTRINAAGNLQIDEVKHKTFIEVNESGTEAAAVTSIGITYTSVIGPSSVLIDRPFVFAIREMKTGLILFTGVINNPLLN
nr:serpin family protein [Pedobacter panaciterrae]